MLDALVEEAVTRHEPGSAEWLAARRNGIGASEVAAILGLDKYKSGLDIWLEKRGLAEGRTDSPQARVGRFAEPMIARLYEDRTGHRVVSVPTRRHPALEVLFASADRMVVDPEDEARWRFPVEIKNRGGLPQGWGEDGTDLVPEAVAVQVHLQMACYGMASAEVAALLGGNDFRIYTLERSEAIESTLLATVAEWWQRHIVEGVEPSLEGPNVADYLASKFRAHTAEVVRVDAGEAVALWLEALADAQGKKKEAEAEYDRAASEVKNFIGDRYAVESTAGRAVWSLSKDSVKVNYEAVARELYRAAKMPEDEWDRYIATFATTKAGSRSFRFTPAKGGL